MIKEKLIKINLPLTEVDFTTGYGEGVWIEVDQKTKDDYDQDAIGTGYCGILANDSLYYPGLCCGEIIYFEMRGPFYSWAAAVFIETHSLLQAVQYFFQ